MEPLNHLEEGRGGTGRGQASMYTDDSMVDDSGEGSLVSSQTVQVEGETLEQSLVAHLEQQRSKRVVWNTNTEASTEPTLLGQE